MTAFVLALCVVALLDAIAFAATRWRPAAAPPHPPGDDEGGDDGGSQRRVPPRVPPEPPDALEPPWWPQFERDLAEYTRERASSHRRAAA